MIPPGTSHVNISISLTYISRWTRISIPLPNAALTDATRFRWKQSGTVAGSMWAIDNGRYCRPLHLHPCTRGHAKLNLSFDSCLCFSLHWSRLPSFLLWEGTLFPYGLQVRMIYVLIVINQHTPLIRIPPSLPADIVFASYSLH